MPPPTPGTDDSNLSRRERQIMEVLYRREEASAQEIAEALPDPPSDTAARTFLRILEAKGRVQRRKVGRRFLYRPRGSKARAARTALRRVLKTFFEGSLGDAVQAHLSDPNARLDPEELERLAALIREARRHDHT